MADKHDTDRSARVFALYEQLLEMEQRLIPTGLHVFGRASSAGEQVDLLKMVASFDRREHGIRALPTEVVGDAVREFLDRGSEAAIRLCEARGLDPGLTQPVFALLENISSRLQTNGELDSLVRALRGEFIEPGPGADIIQNPDVLPTGRNTHAINPYSVPSAAAFARSELVATSLLERYRSENGRYPEAMALVLWGLDNIKTQGEGVAQALWLLGTRPVRDALNRTTSVEAIPLAELGRPRIDVVMTVSGIFRDLFSPTVQLLDKAVRLVAQLDEPLDLNYVRKHVLQQIEQDGGDLDEAAVRVFSNAPGNYGTNVNFMVMDSQWEREETLGDLFVTRKCFAYGRDSRVRAFEGREARVAMDRALSRVEATYQNIDTFEIGLTDVDHYFEYLGGVSKAVEKRAKSRPAIYLSDTLSREVKIRSLEETVRLETRSKT
ncbi:MAG TPA: cobaltochelatase subunit CobN, partial [Pyrinomonadaceae bacterium]|nr:cobaltochelatase subunit CobN [Pyrinomonadaceae bacterium]